MAILVKEYRNGQLIGSVVRDMEMWTYPCSNSLPSLTGINGNNNFEIMACPNQPINFSVYSSDADQAQQLTMDWDHTIPGATFTVSTGPRPTGQFSWTPTSSDIRSKPYSIMVSIRDNNCSTNGFQIYTYNIYVKQLTLGITSTNSSCASPGTGSIEVVPSGVGNFQYNWMPGGMTTSSISNLQPGNYAVTVTGEGGCIASSSAIITAPLPLVSTVTTQDARCAGSSDGSATVIVSGGTPPYSYRWSPVGGTSATASNLVPGNYTVTITDAAGCTTTAAATIQSPAPMQMSFTSVAPSCNDSSGRATVHVTGGSLPYSYAWSNGRGGQSINGVPVGTYTVTVTDARGCTASKSLNLTSNLQIQFTNQGVSCHGSSDGTSIALVTGGTQPYRYRWSSGDSISIAQHLPAGTYSLTVTDAHNCQATLQTTIPDAPAMNIQVFTTPAFCHGEPNGFASIQVSGGTPAYSYSWSNGLNSSSSSNLFAGNYSAVVTDARGCTSQVSFQVTQPDSMVLSFNKKDVSCPGSMDGRAEVTVTGGYPPYKYEWGILSNTSYIDALSQNFYTVKVSDANQCVAKSGVEIGIRSMMSIDAHATDISCHGRNDGRIDVTTSGGVRPYTYSWNTGAHDSTLNNISPGNYTITVTDSLGCTHSASSLIQDPPAVNLVLLAPDTVCKGTSVSLEALCSGGQPGYSYSWNGNAGGSTISINPNGNEEYVVVATDARGCTSGQKNLSVYVYENPAVTLIHRDTICDGDAVIISAAVSGGKRPLQYEWSNGMNTSEIVDRPSGSSQYFVTVSDYCGNTASANGIVRTTPKPEVDFSADPIVGCVPMKVKLESNYEGASSEYTWLFDDGTVINSKIATYNFSTPGVYSVTHRVSSHGCSNQVVKAGFIHANENPVSDFEGSPDVASIKYPLITFRENCFNTTSWLWDFGDNSGLLDERNPVYTYKDTGHYTVRLIAVSSEGCLDTSEQKIFIRSEYAVYVPNAFTPNGDGVNDTFNALGVGVTDYEMLIFNRWGQLIFTTDDLMKGWNGTYNGNAAQPDVYVYKIRATDYHGNVKDYVGHVQLIR